MKDEWYSSTGKLLIVCIVAWPIGLYGIYKNESLSVITKFALGCLCLFMANIMFNFLNHNNNNINNSQVTETTETTDDSVQTQTNVKQQKQPIGIGEILHTKYFDVTVEKAMLSTGEKISDYYELPVDGTKYLIINVTIKNISNESRYLSDGKIVFESQEDGKQYHFDKAESIRVKGWGLEYQINPFISTTGLIAFKLPGEIKGIAYYNPTRSNQTKTDLILLGHIE